MEKKLNDITKLIIEYTQTFEEMAKDQALDMDAEFDFFDLVSDFAYKVIEATSDMIMREVDKHIESTQRDPYSVTFDKITISKNEDI